MYSQNTSPQMLTSLRDMECIEAIKKKQLTASQARQSLPKCNPDTFVGDATLFHPWKSAFKVMLRDAYIPYVGWGLSPSCYLDMRSNLCDRVCDDSKSVLSLRVLKGERFVPRFIWRQR